MLNMTNISISGASLFPVNSTTVNILNSCLYTAAFGINMVLGLPPNCYILWLTVKEMTQAQSPKIFVFNGILAEILFCFAVCFATPYYFFGCTDCRVPMVFLALLVMISRPLFLTFMCIECYIGVLHPLIFLKLKPMKYRITIIALGWIINISSCVFCVTERIVSYNVLLPLQLLCFFVKLYCCLMVLKALLRPGPGDEVKKTNGGNQDKIKAFQVILELLVFATVSYGPMVVSLVLYHILDLERFLLSWSMSLSFEILLGTLYPFLHLKRIGKLPFRCR